MASPIYLGNAILSAAGTDFGAGDPAPARRVAGPGLQARLAAAAVGAAVEGQLAREVGRPVAVDVDEHPARARVGALLGTEHARTRCTPPSRAQGHHAANQRATEPRPRCPRAHPRVAQRAADGELEA